MPDFKDPSLAWAGEIIAEKTSNIEALFQEYWTEKEAELGENYEAKPDDIAEMFTDALQLLDPGGKSGVAVELDPESAQLSWSSEKMAILVGAKRGAIATPEKAYELFLHEGFIHGGRAINGLKTKIPVLGTGLFTNTDPSDYLSFEEGLATTIQETVAKTDSRWNSVKLGHYINIGMAQNGDDFRAVYEKAWRYRALEAIKDDQEPSEDFLAKHKDKAYKACVRIFRGTPTDLNERYPEIAPLTYNKDLSYLNGRYRAMSYLKSLHENQDEEGLLKLISAKYDPMIPEQAKLVEQFCDSDPLEFLE